METRVRRNTRPMRYWGTPWGERPEGLTGALHTDPHQPDSIRKLRLSILGQTLWVCRAKLRENTERDRGHDPGLVVIGSSANSTFPFRALLSSAYPLPPPPVPRFTNLCLHSCSRPNADWSPISRRNVTIKLTRNLISIISVYLQAMSFGFFFFFFFLWSSSDVLDDRLSILSFTFLFFFFNSSKRNKRTI